MPSGAHSRTLTRRFVGSDQAFGRQPEKREVTGSTPVPTTGTSLVESQKDWRSTSTPELRAHYVPTRNWNQF